MVNTPKTVDESFENFMSLLAFQREIPEFEGDLENKGWTKEEYDSTLGKKKNILSFLQEEMGCQSGRHGGSNGFSSGD